MNLRDYAAKVGTALRDAYNAKSAGGIDAAIRDAQAFVRAGNFSKDDRVAFWGAVAMSFRSGAILVEKQENSSLIALMRAIEDAIAAGKG
jgi:hypothetical protein